MQEFWLENLLTSVQDILLQLVQNWSKLSKQFLHSADILLISYIYHPFKIYTIELKHAAHDIRLVIPKNLENLP